MENSISQQESLEALKLINAASTALRLYPADSAQVRDATEKAYLGLRAFLRKYGQLRFSCHDGTCLLSGLEVDKPTQERLQLLTFNDVLKKMGLRELVLGKTLDRTVFSKVLAVFSATPEQIHKSGGSRAFIKRAELEDVFPEEYVAPGQSKEELARKKKVDSALQELAGSQIRPDDLHYLYGKKESEKLRKQVHSKFQSADSGSRCVAAASYSLLQILLKEKSVSVTPVYSRMLVRAGDLVETAGGGNHEEYARKAAYLLSPVVEDPEIIILLCQNYPDTFGVCFYDAIVKSLDGASLGRVYRWMEEQHAKCVEAVDGGTPQMKVVCMAFDRFQQTGRAKQIIAAEKARKLLLQTEESRKTKRVQAGIEALAAGKMDGLKNKEVCASLPATIANLVQNNKEALAAAIIQNVVNGYREKQGEYRSCFALVIGGVAEKLVELERWEWLKKLTPICLARIRETEEMEPSFVQHVQAMQDMMNHAWAEGNNDLAEQILDIFYYIRSGAFEKTDDLRRVIATIQDKNVDLALLQAYLDECFIRPVNEILCRKITMQGPVAARFLLDTLISSDERSDRIRLLKLLSEIGESLVPVLLERLPDPMPWYGKRNIIRLLTETGAEENIPVVLPYMTYEDLRVQQETLQCIVRLGKGAKGKYLLKVLPEVSLGMKIQVVKHLSRVADASIVAPLAALLDDCKLYKGEKKNELAEVICHTLGTSGAESAIPVLQRVVDGSGKPFGKESYVTAKNSIITLQEQKKERLKPRNKPLTVKGMKKQVAKVTVNKAATKAAATVSYEPVTDMPEEQQVYELLAADKLESAKRELLALIEKSAKTNKFKQAEALRQRLIEIDPTALADIIQAAESIEEAKTAGIDENHIIIWSELYDLLTTEEFNEFYHTLDHETYGLEEDVVTQGETQYRLFFVNKGRVKLFFKEKDNEILVKTIGSGQVFGGDSFFDDSVWTLNATTMGNVEVSTLAVDKLKGWKKNFPALEPKLHDYCIRVSNEQEFFQGSGANRRNEERLECDASVKLDLCTEEGVTGESTLKGTGSDISKGGLSFISRIAKRKHARTLLGRPVKVHLEIEGQKSDPIAGRVVAVRNLHSAELGRSVHISFEKELEEATLLQLSKSR